MYSQEDIISHAEEVDKIINKVIMSKTNKKEVDDEFGKHLFFRGLSEEEKDLLLKCTSPLGIDAARHIISQYYEWFHEDVPAETIQKFAVMVQNVGVYALHKGMEKDGTENGSTDPERALLYINKCHQAINKIKRECGLHGEVCQKCPNCLKGHSHCHNGLCKRNFILQP